VQRRIFGPRREEEAGHWRRLHNEELHNFERFAKYCYGEQIKEAQIGMKCRTHGTDGKFIQNGNEIKEDQIRRACSTDGSD